MQKIAWHSIRSLPKNKHESKSLGNAYLLVWSYLGELQKWITAHRSGKAPKKQGKKPKFIEKTVVYNVNKEVEAEDSEEISVATSQKAAVEEEDKDKSTLSLTEEPLGFTNFKLDHSAIMLAFNSS